MPTRAFVTIEDYNGEVTNTFFWVQDISVLNYESVTQDIDEVKDAIAAVTRGVVKEAGFTKTFPESFAQSTDPEAQREDKWLVTYRDTTQFLDAANTIANPGYGKVFNMEIGTSDRSGGNLLPNSDFADVNDGDVMEALVTSLEANIRSPYNNSANTPTITVLNVQYVGRRT